jgi:hypothetical protein
VRRLDGALDSHSDDNDSLKKQPSGFDRWAVVFQVRRPSIKVFSVYLCHRRHHQVLIVRAVASLAA